MKILFLTLLASFSFGASIQCTNRGEVISVEKTEDIEYFAESCDWALAQGSVCFTGKRGEALSILEELSDYPYIISDEYEMHSVWYVGKTKLGYKVYDGPNDDTASHQVSRCSEN